MTTTYINGDRADPHHASQTRVIWTVSQDGGKTVSGGYMGQRAKELATRESGGRTVRMTEGQFVARYPHADRVTLA